MYKQFLKQRSKGNYVSVLVAPRDASLSQIKNATKDSETSIVEDHVALTKLTTEILDNSRFSRIKDRARKFVEHLPLEVSYQTGTGDKYAAGLYPNLSASSTSLPHAYIVYENDSSPAQLAALISPLSIQDEEVRPKIIFRPHSSAASLEQKLASVGEKIALYEIGPFGPTNRRYLKGNTCNYTESEALELYLNFGFKALAEHTLEFNLEASDSTKAYELFFKSMFQINSIIKSNGRSDARLNTIKLITFVDELKDQEIGVPEEELLKMKALVNILHGFVFEDSALEIQNTMAIGHHLEDEFLIALGERLINLVEGVDPSSIDWLKSAENRFWKLGEPVQAAYSKHNRLITMLSSNIPMDIIEFSDHAYQLREMAPYCERMSSVRQGVAIACLLEDQIEHAHRLYTLSLGDSGNWLHLAEARVGKLICEYLLGDLSSDEIERCARIIVANIGSSKITYHHKRLVYNILRLGEVVGGKQISQTMFLEASVISLNEASNLEMLFANIVAKMPVSAPNGILVGRRGAFFARTKLAPGCGFIWH